MKLNFSFIYNHSLKVYKNSIDETETELISGAQLSKQLHKYNTMYKQVQKLYSLTLTQTLYDVLHMV